MNEILVRILWAVLPSIFCALVMLYFNRKIAKRDAEIERRAELRKKESLLQLKMEFAIGKLSYAVAMAIKRGEPNGEVEEGVKAYNEAISEYNKFVNDLHKDVLEKGEI